MPELKQNSTKDQLRNQKNTDTEPKTQSKIAGRSESDGFYTSCGQAFIRIQKN